MNELYHHGILGQRWGQTNGPPYPLDPSDHSAAERKAMRADKRWVKKNDKKIRKYATSATRDAMKQYVKKELNPNVKKYNKTGKMSQQYIIAYNKMLANLMNQSIDGLEAPSGRVVKFIAKRGNIGVYTALADKGYDLSQLKQGVYAGGKVAYRKTQVDMDYGNDRRRR